MFFHRVHGGGHGKIGFACACGPETEHDIVVEQGADVAVLAWGAPADVAALGVEMVGVVVVAAFNVLRVGGFGFHGGKLDVFGG